MAVYFGGYSCINAKSFQEAYLKELEQRPDSPHVDSFAIGKANSYINVRGSKPGVGWVLLPRKSLDEIFNSGQDTFSFEISDGNIKNEAPNRLSFPGMTIEETMAMIYPGKAYGTDQNTTYLVKFRDKKYKALYHNLHIRFNVPDPEYPGIPNIQTSAATSMYAGLADTYAINTWDDLYRIVWGKIPELGAYPGVPATILGKPHNIQGLGVLAMDFLEVALKHNGLELAYDPENDIFLIEAIGSTPSEAWDINYAEYANVRLADRRPDNPMDVGTNPLPEKLIIYFPKSGWAYGQTRHEPTTGDAWRNNPQFTLEVDLTDGFGVEVAPGTSFPIHDPMAAIFSQDNRIMNLCDLEDRSNELALAFINSWVSNSHKQFLTYAGHCNGDWKPDAYVSAVRYYDIGNGTKTDVVKRQSPIIKPEIDWSLDTDKDFKRLVLENFEPPDLHREQPPYTRVVHATLLTPLPPYGFASAKLLWKPSQSYSQDQTPCSTEPSKCDWTLNEGTGNWEKRYQKSHCDGDPTASSPGAVYPNPWDWEDTGQAIINVHDFHGHYLDRGTRITAMYHWQSGTWVVIQASVPEFHAALLARTGTSYKFIEAEFNGIYSKVRPEGRCGYAVHANGQSHNSQGGVHPEVVRMYRAAGNGFALGTGWVFEYSVGPAETPGERFEINPGDSWDRNNAPQCTKGFRICLVTISSSGGGTISTTPNI